MTDKLHFDDLTAITCPLGMLDDDTQERLEAWPHGWETYAKKGWEYCHNPMFMVDYAYRAISAPNVTSTWQNVYQDRASHTYTTRKAADDYAPTGRIAVLRRDTINGVTTCELEGV